MLRINATNEKPLNLLIIGIISCFFGVMILLYDYKAAALLIFMSLVLVFFIRVEYVFYFFLASRSIIDIFYNVESAGDIRITHYVGVLIVVLFLSYFLISGYNIFRSGINKIYFTFMLFALYPAFTTQDVISGSGEWLKLLLPICILNMTVLIVLQTDGRLYKERLIIICWVTISALVIPYVLFLKNYTQGTSIEVTGYVRYAAFGSYPNLFSYYLLAVFPVCLFLYSISTKRWGKIFWLVFMGIMLITIYKTYTRNVWIGVAIILLTWNLIRKKFKLIVICLVVGIIIVSVNPEVRDRFSELSEILSAEKVSDIDPKLLSGRVNRWSTNLKYFINESTFIEMLFGNGFDVKSKVASLYLGIGDRAIPEHNNYLTLLMNTGICGLIIYNLYIFKLFQESFKLLRNTKETYLKNLARIFISILCAYLITSIFTHMISKLEYQYYFSALGGIIVAANILEDKKRCVTMVNNYANI